MRARSPWPLLLALFACGPERAQTVGKTPDPGSKSTVCATYNAAIAGAREGPFAGNVMSCDPGVVDPASAARALALMNAYRSFLSLPPVTASAELNSKAQACALMMDANDALSHTPPTSWRCYSEAGAEGAGSSNISTAPIVSSIDLFMLDPGNETTLGHRRWIISNGLSEVGFGSAPQGSCLWVVHPFQGDRAWTAWPAPGPFPSGALRDRFANLDNTGWSVQSDTIDLSRAKVSVTSAGQPRPVSTSALLPNFGSGTAIKFVPQGWSATVGETYAVQISGIGAVIEYSVEIVDCGV